MACLRNSPPCFCVLLPQLHDWDVDFAAWCSYKYLNSGPGAFGGAFVHDKNTTADLPKLKGWWGTNKTNRYVVGAAA